MRPVSSRKQFKLSGESLQVLQEQGLSLEDLVQLQANSLKQSSNKKPPLSELTESNLSIDELEEEEEEEQEDIEASIEDIVQMDNVSQKKQLTHSQSSSSTSSQAGNLTHELPLQEIKKDRRTHKRRQMGMISPLPLEKSREDENDDEMIMIKNKNKDAFQKAVDLQFEEEMRLIAQLPSDETLRRMNQEEIMKQVIPKNAYQRLLDLTQKLQPNDFEEPLPVHTITIKDDNDNDDSQESSELKKSIREGIAAEKQRIKEEKNRQKEQLMHEKLKIKLQKEEEKKQKELEKELLQLEKLKIKEKERELKMQEKAQLKLNRGRKTKIDKSETIYGSSQQADKNNNDNDDDIEMEMKKRLQKEVTATSVLRTMQADLLASILNGLDLGDSTK
jgi:hypothetical protein